MDIAHGLQVDRDDVLVLVGPQHGVAAQRQPAQRLGVLEPALRARRGGQCVARRRRRTLSTSAAVSVCMMRACFDTWLCVLGTPSLSSSTKGKFKYLRRRRPTRRQSAPLPSRPPPD